MNIYTPDIPLEPEPPQRRALAPPAAAVEAALQRAATEELVRSARFCHLISGLL